MQCVIKIRTPVRFCSRSCGYPIDHQGALYLSTLKFDFIVSTIIRMNGAYNSETSNDCFFNYEHHAVEGHFVGNKALSCLNHLFFFSSRITQGCVDDSGNHLSPGRVRTLAEKIKNKTFVCWFVSFFCAAEIVI